MISYDDFAKLDIRIGTIVSVEKVPDTLKLLKLTIDVGEDNPRQIIAGIAEYVSEPQTLVNKQVPVLSNLKPRIIKGFESQGMILVVSDDTRFSLLAPSIVVSPGSHVK